MATPKNTGVHRIHSLRTCHSCLIRWAAVRLVCVVIIIEKVHKHNLNKFAISVPIGLSRVQVMSDDQPSSPVPSSTDSNKSARSGPDKIVPNTTSAPTVVIKKSPNIITIPYSKSNTVEVLTVASGTGPTASTLTATKILPKTIQLAKGTTFSPLRAPTKATATITAASSQALLQSGHGHIVKGKDQSPRHHLNILLEHNYA